MRAEPDLLSVVSLTEIASESDPAKPRVGAYVSPLRAVLRFESVPRMVNDAEPLEPAVKTRPWVEPRVSVPFETDRVAESAFPLVPLSVNEIRLALPDEKTSDPFSLTVADTGAGIEGADTALTMSATFAEVLRVVRSSVSTSANESEPV